MSELQFLSQVIDAKADRIKSLAREIWGYAELAYEEEKSAAALQQALAGVHFPGYKVVQGRSVRKYSDPDAVASVVANAGYEPYEKKLLGITEMTKQLGKKTFNELLGGLIVKPPGKPVLAPEDDKRTEYSTAANDFMEE